MDFGNRLAFDGQASPAPDSALPTAWFERSSAAEPRLGNERGLFADSNGLLDRLREAGGLVYSDESDDDL